MIGEERRFFLKKNSTIYEKLHPLSNSILYHVRYISLYIPIFLLSHSTFLPLSISHTHSLSSSLALALKKKISRFHNLRITPSF